MEQKIVKQHSASEQKKKLQQANINTVNCYMVTVIIKIVTNRQEERQNHFLKNMMLVNIEKNFNKPITYVSLQIT